MKQVKIKDKKSNHRVRMPDGKDISFINGVAEISDEYAEFFELLNDETYKLEDVSEENRTEVLGEPKKPTRKRRKRK